MLKIADQTYHCQMLAESSSIWHIQCHLQILQPHAEVQTVILTDMGFEVGWFIPHLLERLAEQIVRDFRLDPNKVIWLEHYTAEHGKTDSADYSQVTFEWHNGHAANPQWIAIAPETAQALVSENLLLV